MKKKILLPVLLSAVLLLAVSAVILWPFLVSRPFPKALGYDEKSIVKIESFYFPTDNPDGPTLREFTDPERIAQILACFSEIPVKKEFSLPPSYSIGAGTFCSKLYFYDENGLVAYFSYPSWLNHWQITDLKNDVYYVMQQPISEKLISILDEK